MELRGEEKKGWFSGTESWPEVRNGKKSGQVAGEETVVRLWKTFTGIFSGGISFQLQMKIQ